MLKYTSGNNCKSVANHLMIIRVSFNRKLVSIRLRIGLQQRGKARVV